jgi:galactokinase
MDQFANLYGRERNAMFLNCADMNFHYVPLEFEDLQFILINSNVKHQLSDSPYNQRKSDCRAGFMTLQKKYPELTNLSEATLTQLESVRKDLSDTVHSRCLYVLEENQRVRSSKSAIENKDWQQFGKLLCKSHEGLRDLYEVSCTELDLLVELAAKQEAVLGSRMVGGGFGGCTLNLVKTRSAKNSIEHIVNKYEHLTGLYASVYPVQISNGTSVIELE